MLLSAEPVLVADVKGFNKNIEAAKQSLALTASCKRLSMCTTPDYSNTMPANRHLSLQIVI